MPLRGALAAYVHNPELPRIAYVFQMRVRDSDYSELFMLVHNFISTELKLPAGAHGVSGVAGGRRKRWSYWLTFDAHGPDSKAFCRALATRLQRYCAARLPQVEVTVAQARLQSSAQKAAAFSVLAGTITHVEYCAL